MIDEVKYLNNQFLSPIRISSCLGAVTNKPGMAVCLNPCCKSGRAQFPYTAQDLLQSIERNDISQKIAIGYWVVCPSCKKYVYVGGVS